MRSRSISAIAASLLLAQACGGGAFRSSDGQGGADGNAGVGGSGLPTTGGKNQGGSGDAGKAGSGSSAGGASPGVAGHSTSAGEASGGDSGAAGGSTGPECMVAADCRASTKCKRAVCQAGGVCVEENLPNGPYSLQVSGDCKRLECSDGKEVIVMDPADADDANECTTDSCVGGNVLHTPRPGQPCTAGGSGICSMAGACEPA
ncbi:MAG TPA: hypothetical protein VIW29_06180 [Polyangiaceae bacterium]